MEIERRWRVSKDNIPFGKITDEYEIEQVYSCQYPEVRIRKEVRHTGEIDYYHCTKYKIDDLQKIEIQQNIFEDDYNSIFKFINKKPVVKCRRIIPLGRGLKAEVDYFYKTNKYIVEVEFHSIEEADSFVAPDWFGNEITGVDISRNVFNMLNRQATLKEKLEIYC